MKPVRYGAAVLGIEGQRVGTVAGVNGCCFEVLDEVHRFTITFDGVNQVTDRVELVCMAAEVGRFACGMHETKAAV